MHFLYSWLGSRLPAGSGSTSKNIMRDWQQIAVESHYLTAVGVKEALEAGDIHEALRGIDELIDAMRRSEQRAVRSQLVRLMTHILKWHAQPTHRSPSWVATINHARQEIWDSGIGKIKPLFTQSHPPASAHPLPPCARWGPRLGSAHPPHAARLAQAWPGPALSGTGRPPARAAGPG